MTKHPAARLLEVTITAEKPAIWKWCISEGNKEIMHGYEASRETAQFHGDNELFNLRTDGRQ
jgi:hypothetical protein